MLLTALNDGTIRRVGGAAETPAHGARRRGLQRRALPPRPATARFRPDLLMRLNPSLALEIPPLADRRADLPELARATAAAFFDDARHRRAIASLVRAAGGPEPEGAVRPRAFRGGGARSLRPRSSSSFRGRRGPRWSGIPGPATCGSSRWSSPTRSPPPSTRAPEPRSTARAARGSRWMPGCSSTCWPGRAPASRPRGADPARPAAVAQRRRVPPRPRKSRAARPVPGDGGRLRAHGRTNDRIPRARRGPCGCASTSSASRRAANGDPRRAARGAGSAPPSRTRRRSRATAPPTPPRSRPRPAHCSRPRDPSLPPKRSPGRGACFAPRAASIPRPSSRCRRRTSPFSRATRKKAATCSRRPPTREPARLSPAELLLLGRRAETAAPLAGGHHALPRAVAAACCRAASSPSGSRPGCASSRSRNRPRRSRCRRRGPRSRRGSPWPTASAPSRPGACAKRGPSCAWRSTPSRPTSRRCSPSPRSNRVPAARAPRSRPAARRSRSSPTASRH